MTSPEFGGNGLEEVFTISELIAEVIKISEDLGIEVPHYCNLQSPANEEFLKLFENIDNKRIVSSILDAARKQLSKSDKPRANFTFSH